MKDELAKAEREALAFLALNQAPDGSFMGQASFNKEFNGRIIEQPTPFPTALIMNCLSEIEAAVVMRQTAANFLLSQRSQEWTWNYWLRQEGHARAPYPDDLDDTSHALAALQRHNPRLVSGAAWAAFSKIS